MRFSQDGVDFSVGKQTNNKKWIVCKELRNIMQSNMDFLILFVRLILLDLIILVFCLSDKILGLFNAVRNIKGLHGDR